MADVSKISPDNGVNIYDLKDTPARNMMTDVFDTETSYAVGDYCIYNGTLYKCSTAHEGVWVSEDFTATTIANELKNAGGGGGDLSAYQTKNLVTPLTINGSSQTTVESALGALNTVDATKQPKTMSSSITVSGYTQTTVEGTLNALNNYKQPKTMSSSINISDGRNTSSASTVENALSNLNTKKQGIYTSTTTFSIPGPDGKKGGVSSAYIDTYIIDTIIRSLATGLGWRSPPITPSTASGYSLFLVVSNQNPGNATSDISSYSVGVALVYCSYTSTNMSCRWTNIGVDSSGKGLLTGITRSGQGTSAVKLTLQYNGNSGVLIIPIC